MKKTNIRDYAISAMRYYGEAEKNKKVFVLPENKRLASGCILDMMAVEKTLRQLKETERGEEILQALKMVYFTMPERAFKAGEISGRVQFASEKLYVSEPTVYRMLSDALFIFAENRGLRISLF